MTKLKTSKQRKIEKMKFPNKDSDSKYPINVRVNHIIWDKIQEIIDWINQEEEDRKILVGEE